LHNTKGKLASKLWITHHEHSITLVIPAFQCFNPITEQLDVFQTLQQSVHNHQQVILCQIQARPATAVHWSGTVKRNPAMIAALIPPATGSVTSQATTMLRNIDQSTFSRARNLPTNTTEPTLQWVVLIGMPTLDAMRTVSAEPISMQNPLKSY